MSEMLPFLPPSERKIASFIIANPKESISLTAMELGKRSLTSGATVIRLCKSLNLKGFQDLKLRIAGDLQKESIEEYRDIEPNETTASIIEKMTTNCVQTIKETAELLDYEEVGRAVQSLINAKRIHFFGVGASSVIALDAQQKFLRINKTAFAFTDMHLAVTQIANVDEGDVVVGISFSGGTVEVAKVMQLARSHKATTISLTKYGKYLVTEHSDINLYTSLTREPTLRSGATSSRIAQLQLIDILFMCVASMQYAETLNYLNMTKEAVEFITK